MNNRALRLSAVLVIFLLAACKSDSVSTVNGGLLSNELSGLGDYRYTLNGSEFHRRNSALNTRAYAERYVSSADDFTRLNIYLFNDGSLSEQLPSVEILLDFGFNGPTVTTHTINRSEERR